MHKQGSQGVIISDSPFVSTATHQTTYIIRDVGVHNRETVRQASRCISESVSLGRAIEGLEAANTKQRQGTQTDNHSGEFSEPVKRRTRDKWAVQRDANR